MGRGYSMDLRERLVAGVNAGLSRRGVARLLKVSNSCAVKLPQRVAKTGSSAPTRQGRPPGGGKLSAHRDFLIVRRREAGHRLARTRRRIAGGARRRGNHALAVASPPRGGLLI